MSIPKIIHMIWIGQKPFPYQKNLNSYKKHHPEWTIYLWTDKNIPKMTNQRIYDSIPIFATKADILRLEILAKYGGVYVDADSICLKPLDTLVKNEDCFFSTNWKGKIEINFMGCTPSNKLMETLIKKLPKYWARKRREKCEFNVYCIYRFIRKKISNYEFTKFARKYNCMAEERTHETYIIQKMDHTWAGGKQFRLPALEEAVERKKLTEEVAL